MTPFKDLEVVRMAVAMPDKHLVVGSTVCIVYVHNGGEAYEVEIVTPKGNEVLTMTPDKLMPLDSPIPEENKLKGA